MNILWDLDVAPDDLLYILSAAAFTGVSGGKGQLGRLLCSRMAPSIIARRKKRDMMFNQLVPRIL